jgi:conjugative transfer pilus assembly protein TraH
MTHKPTRLRKIIATLSAASLVASTSISVRASIASEMETLYNGLSQLPADVAAGVTGGLIADGPSAFRGQAFHTYMGGRVYQRVPIRNLQFANIEMPRFSAGCGGIDMYLGSFSHLSAEQLLDFLRATAMNATGVITQVALGAITPLLASKLEWAKGVIDQINGMNKNSCETAQHLVSGAAGIATSGTAYDCIQRRMIYEGMDSNEATEECDTEAKIANAQAGSPNSLPLFTGNLTWEALKRALPDAPRDEREMIMSMVGTRIYNKNRRLSDPAPPGTPAHRPPHNAQVAEKVSIQVSPGDIQPVLFKIEQVLRGEGDDGSDNVWVDMLVCNEEVECLEPTVRRVSIQSYSKRVSRYMYRLADAIDRHNEIEVDLQNFINQASLPVYSMMSIGKELPNSSMAELLIETYRDVVAADYAFALLARNLNAGAKALRLKFHLDTAQEEDQKEIIAASRQRLQELNRERNDALKKVADINAITNALQNLQRTMAASMPHHVLQMTSGAAGHGATGKK